VLVLINTSFLITTRDIIFSTKKLFVQSQASFIATHLEETFDVPLNEDEERVTAVVSQLEVTGDTNIVITDCEGVILYDPAEKSKHISFSADSIARSLEGYDIFHSRFADGAFSSSAYTPVFGQGEAIGAVFFNEVDTDQASLFLEMQDTLINIPRSPPVFLWFW